MSDYAFVHNGKAYTPNQTTVAVDDVAAHNQAIADRELAHWASRPDLMLAYYDLPGTGAEYFGRRTPVSYRGTVKTWTGEKLGVIVQAHVYRHNFGSRMVSVRVEGSNGATYYGRASYDGGNCIRLRKVRQ